MSEAQTHYTTTPTEPPNGPPPGPPDGLGERTAPLSPYEAADLCIPVYPDNPERLQSFWLGTLIHILSQEYLIHREDQWLWSFDREILGYIARLPGGAALVERYEREHTLDPADFRGLPKLQIQQQVLCLFWPQVGGMYLWDTEEEAMSELIGSIDVPESIDSPEELDAYLDTVPSYQEKLQQALQDLFSNPHEAVEAIEVIAEHNAIERRKSEETFLMQEDSRNTLEPLPNDTPDVPAFDPTLLPTTLRPFVTDIAERMQCPIDFPATALMVALSSVVGRQVSIRPQEKDDWSVTPNLWGLIIGPPGAMKSPPMKEVLKPVEALEKAARERYKHDLSAYEAKLKVAKQATKVADQEIKKALGEGDGRLAEEIAYKSKRETPIPPTRQRYVTQDTTIEKLGELLAGNPNGMLIYRDELVGWLRTLEKQGHESARAFYLEAWDGNGRFTVDRIARGTIEIEAATVSILGSIQPGPLKAYLTGALKGGAGDDGLLQRFQLAVWPDQSKTWTPVDRKPDYEARQKAFEVFLRLSALQQIMAERDLTSSRPYLRFAPDAQAEFKEWRASLELRLRAGDDPESFESVIAKQRSLIPSLALLIHLAELPQGGAVSLSVLQKALRWAEYLEAHARRIYATTLSSETTAVHALVKKIREGDLDLVFDNYRRASGTEHTAFTARDVYKNHWKDLDRESAVKALDWLVKANWLWKQTIQTKGRPTTFYFVNPEVLH